MPEAEATSIIDSHCHLDGYYYQGVLGEVLRNAREAGVDRLITVGTGDGDWDLYAQLAAEHPGVIDYTVGLHPCNVETGWERPVAQLKTYFQHEAARPAALGEIGLDYFHLPKRDLVKAGKIKALQLEAFRAQLQIVNELGCPVVIHSRGAFEDCIQELDAATINWNKVVFHCFAEDARAMRALNERGGRGSFTGILTFKNAQPVREALLQQGLDRLMFETDAPYLAPEPHRGKPCVPAYAALTLGYSAKLLGMTDRALAGISRKNTMDFFGLDRVSLR